MTPYVMSAIFLGRERESNVVDQVRVKASAKSGRKGGTTAETTLPENSRPMERGPCLDKPEETLVMRRKRKKHRGVNYRGREREGTSAQERRMLAISW